MRGMPEPKISEAVKATIIQLYREGKKTKEITDATGVGRSTIYYILGEQNVRTNRKSGPRPKLPDEEYQSLLEKLMARVIELERENAVLLERLRADE